MRWLLLLLLTTSCATASPVTAKAAEPQSITSAPLAVARNVTRRKKPYAQIQGATLVTEIEDGRCTFGLEIPIGAGMVSRKSGVWLVMPSDACENDPDVHRTTDFILWRGADMTSLENTSPEDRAAALGAPIEFLPPRDGVAVASALLDSLPPLPATVRSKQRLAIWDAEGRRITNRNLLLSLCKKDNPEACFIAGDSPDARDRRALLEKSCGLGENEACYTLGLDLRAAALAAIRNSPEVRDLLGFSCGVGKGTGLTPILANDAATCPAPASQVVAK